MLLEVISTILVDRARLLCLPSMSSGSVLVTCGGLGHAQMSGWHPVGLGSHPKRVWMEPVRGVCVPDSMIE